MLAQKEVTWKIQRMAQMLFAMTVHHAHFEKKNGHGTSRPLRNEKWPKIYALAATAILLLRIPSRTISVLGAPQLTQRGRGNSSRLYEVNIWTWRYGRGRPRVVSIAEAERVRTQE